MVDNQFKDRKVVVEKVSIEKEKTDVRTSTRI